MHHVFHKFSFVTSIFLIYSSIAFSQSNLNDSILEKQANETFNAISAKFKGNSKGSTGDLIIKIGLEFLGKPYVAKTLENNKSEKLVINLSEFDCTTFAENCLALARTLKSPACTFDNFKKELLLIRYRNGELVDYSSRLHYFSDWIYDNDRKNTVKNITCEMGHTPFNRFVDYMSQHTDSYKMLKNDLKLQNKISLIENQISKRQSCYIPKNQISKYELLIHNGDILGLTTNIKGMDIAHVVIAYHTKGRLYMIHASSKEHKVVISTKPMANYLANRKDVTGIMVARPL
jgi:hypothetical protein